jgi:hypothetical protein
MTKSLVRVCPPGRQTNREAHVPEWREEQIIVVEGEGEGKVVGGAGLDPGVEEEDITLRIQPGSGFLVARQLKRYVCKILSLSR